MRRQFFERATPVAHRLGAEVLDHDVGDGDESPEERAALLGVHLEREVPGAARQPAVHDRVRDARRLDCTEFVVKLYAGFRSTSGRANASILTTSAPSSASMSPVVFPAMNVPNVRTRSSRCSAARSRGRGPGPGSGGRVRRCARRGTVPGARPRTARAWIGRARPACERRRRRNCGGSRSSPAPSSCSSATNSAGVLRTEHGRPSAWPRSTSSPRLRVARSLLIVSARPSKISRRTSTSSSDGVRQLGRIVEHPKERTPVTRLVRGNVERPVLALPGTRWGITDRRGAILRHARHVVAIERRSRASRPLRAPRCRWSDHRPRRGSAARPRRKRPRARLASSQCCCPGTVDWWTLRRPDPVHRPARRVPDEVRGSPMPVRTRESERRDRADHRVVRSPRKGAGAFVEAGEGTTTATATSR